MVILLAGLGDFLEVLQAALLIRSGCSDIV
jgi:hypothetical protein